LTYSWRLKEAPGSGIGTPVESTAERPVAMDHATRSYTYLMEDGNVGLAGSRNTISLFDYGGDGGATLVVWSF